jgi:hypothetical protein
MTAISSRRTGRAPNGTAIRWATTGSSCVSLAVDALATARLTRLAVEDELTRGPREWVLDRVDPDQTRPSKLGYLLQCHWCSSVWIGMGVVAARRVFPRSWPPVATALAFSEVAGLLGTRAANQYRS